MFVTPPFPFASASGSSFYELQSSFSVSAASPPPQCAHLSGSSHEVPCLFARSVSWVRRHAGFHTAAACRPWAFSTLRRFAPQKTLWACFIPLARPGFALQGFSLARSRSGSSPSLALMQLPPTNLTVSGTTRLRLRFRALTPLASPLRRFHS